MVIAGITASRLTKSTNTDQDTTLGAGGHSAHALRSAEDSLGASKEYTQLYPRHKSRVIRNSNVLYKD